MQVGGTRGQGRRHVQGLQQARMNERHGHIGSLECMGGGVQGVHEGVHQGPLLHLSMPLLLRPFSFFISLVLPLLLSWCRYGARPLCMCSVLGVVLPWVGYYGGDCQGLGACLACFETNGDYRDYRDRERDCRNYRDREIMETETGAAAETEPTPLDSFQLIRHGLGKQ